MNSKKLLGKGIIRNRMDRLLEQKKNIFRKKNRFQLLGKDSDEVTYDPKSNEEFKDSLLETTQNSSKSEIGEQHTVNSEYDQAQKKLQRVKVLQMKISALAKTRLQSFKESETKQLDKNIVDFASEAMECIVLADKNLSAIKAFEPHSTAELKFVRNMQNSLASQIRQATKQLRTQEKDYFSKVKAYESGSNNSAIELTPMDKEKMSANLYAEQQEMIEDELQKQRDEQINELVSNINKLSSIYKELNQMVIDQGTIIDRIDYNIDETYKHTQKAVTHLKKADQHASSPFAERCIRILLAIIITGAIILAYKYSSSK